MVRWTTRSLLAATCLGVAALMIVTGCERKSTATSQPAPQPEEQVSTDNLTLLPAESRVWTRDEALAHLDDEKLAVCAAVRIVQLSDTVPLCLPGELCDNLIKRLRLVQLNEAYHALGLTDFRDERRLYAPVLITVTGDVEQLAEGVEEECLSLHIAEDPDVFPHVAVVPGRVLLIEDVVAVALSLEPTEQARFELRRFKDFPYISLVALHAADEDEAARFAWEPYELVFTGPAIDMLPDPPGGRFNIDMELSERLEPMGGLLPEPEEIKTTPDQPEEAPRRFDDDLIAA